MSWAISVAGLRKSFGESLVLDGIDLTVAEGTVFSLLGPNGAGKTTIVQILSTLIPAGAGRDRGGRSRPGPPPRGGPGAIGATGQFSGVDQLLTGEENLRLMASLHHLGRAPGRARTGDLLARFDLTGAARRPASTCSGGMRRRLDLAMTLMGDPRLIFLRPHRRPGRRPGRNRRPGRRRGDGVAMTAYALSDSATMLRRNLLHLRRYPSCSPRPPWPRAPRSRWPRT